MNHVELAQDKAQAHFKALSEIASHIYVGWGLMFLILMRKTQWVKLWMTPLLSEMQRKV